MEYLVLNNGSKIAIERGSSIYNAVAVFDSKSIMAATWELLEKENLEKVQVVNEDGELIAEYNGLILNDETSVVLENGKVLTTFHFRKKTELELLKEEIENLKAGQEVQDGAIVELAEIIGG